MTHCLKPGDLHSSLRIKCHQRSTRQPTSRLTLLRVAEIFYKTPNQPLGLQTQPPRIAHEVHSDCSRYACRPRHRLCKLFSRSQPWLCKAESNRVQLDNRRLRLQEYSVCSSSRRGATISETGATSSRTHRHHQRRDTVFYDYLPATIVERHAKCQWIFRRLPGELPFMRLALTLLNIRPVPRRLLSRSIQTWR